MALLLSLLLACGTPADQPAALAYDHLACDHCGMMVSDPRFAAQLITRQGERFEFDDPACVFLHIADRAPQTAHIWFHDFSRPEDPTAWLDWQRVSFVEAQGAPMNGGLGAVPLGGPAGPASGVVLSFSEASARVLGAHAATQGAAP